MGEVHFHAYGGFEIAFSTGYATNRSITTTWTARLGVEQKVSKSMLVSAQLEVDGYQGVRSRFVVSVARVLH